MHEFGHRADGTSDWDPDNIGHAIKASARRMGTEYVDIVLLHNPPLEILDGTRSDHELFTDVLGAGHLDW